MTVRLIDPTLHGLLDYAAAAGLIFLPFLLGIGRVEPLAPWLSVGAGALLIFYSLFTDYRFGVVRLLPYFGHLLADLLAAAGFIAVPFIFGFSGWVAVYFWFMAAGVIAVVVFSGIPGPSETVLTQESGI